MELILLGTGNAQATRCYNTCFALRRDGDTRLFELREDNADDARRLLERWAAEYAG